MDGGHVMHVQVAGIVLLLVGLAYAAADMGFIGQMKLGILPLLAVLAGLWKLLDAKCFAK